MSVTCPAKISKSSIFTLGHLNIVTRIETILHIMLKFQVVLSCFQGGI